MSEHLNPAVILMRKQGLSWVRACDACGHFDVAATHDERFVCRDCRGPQLRPEFYDDVGGED